MAQGQFYTDSFNGIINQYLLKFQEEGRLYRSANILLIVAGVFGVAYITLGIYKLNDLQILSFVPLIVVYIYSIYFIAIPPSIWPWVHIDILKKLEQENNSEQVYRSLTIQIFKLTGEVDKLLRKYLRYIWWNVYFLSLSALWTFIIYFIHDDVRLLAIILLPLSYVLGIAFYLHYKRLLTDMLKKWTSMNQ
jgi:hypothetical protein